MNVYYFPAFYGGRLVLWFVSTLYSLGWSLFRPLASYLAANPWDQTPAFAIMVLLCTDVVGLITLGTLSWFLITNFVKEHSGSHVPDQEAAQVRMDERIGTISMVELPSGLPEHWERNQSLIGS